MPGKHHDAAIDRVVNATRHSDTTVRLIVDEYQRAVKELTPPRKPRPKGKGTKGKK